MSRENGNWTSFANGLKNSIERIIPQHVFYKFLGIRNILASLLFYFDLGKGGEGRGACCNLHSNINICQVKRERGNHARHRPWQSAVPPAHADVPKPALNQQEGTEECKHQAPQQQPHCCPCCQSSAEDAALVAAGNCTARGWAGVCSPASTRGCEEHELCFNARTGSVRIRRELLRGSSTNGSAQFHLSVI